MTDKLPDKCCGPNYSHPCCLCNSNCDCPYSYTGCMGCSSCEDVLTRDDEGTDCPCYEKKENKP